MPASRSRRWAPAVAGAVLPWTWLLIRSLGGRLEAVAVALPLVLLVVLGVLLAIGAALREARVLPATVSLILLGALTIVGPLLPRTGPAPLTPIRLVAANVFFDNPTPEAAVDLLLAAEADIEVAVETSLEFRELLEERDAAHPYAVIDDQLVVRSRYPIVAMPDPPGLPVRRILRVTVEAPGGPFVLYAIHALNPLSESTFASQLDWVERLRTAAAAEAAPVVMAGDFNMSDRQLGYRRLTTDLRDAVTASGWGHATYPDGIWAPLLLRIDHVFVPEGWCAAGARTLDVPGSDHDGLEVEVGPCP